MITAELTKYVEEVEAQYAKVVPDFQKAIADGNILHALQWQTAQVATVIHEHAKAQVLKAIVAQLGTDTVAGFDLYVKPCVSGRGCLVGHEKHRGKSQMLMK